MKLMTLAVPSFAVALLAAQACAQTAADMKTVCSSADVAALIANARRERKADQPTFTQPILKFAPYTASLEYRAAVGPAGGIVGAQWDAFS